MKPSRFALPGIHEKEVWIERICNLSPDSCIYKRRKSFIDAPTDGDRATIVWLQCNPGSCLQRDCNTEPIVVGCMDLYSKENKQ